MTDTIPLHQLFAVGERFHRSVNIAADYTNPRALDDYIPTSLSRAVLSRIAHGLGGDSTGRAWSITGPYGAGKSGAVLFLAQVLGYLGDGRARRLLESTDPELSGELYDLLPGLEIGGFIIVPLLGGHEPISWSLLKGLVTSLSSPDILTPELVPHVDEMRDLYNRARDGGAVASTSIAEVIHQSVEALQSADPAVLGLLLIYDELGKALEYAAIHPELADIGILQTVAELASRSGPAPCGLITILHQAFEHYAAGLSPVQQREWAKVQGRFEDIGFLESSGELLGLIDKAIHPVEGLDASLESAIASEVARAEQLGLLPTDLDRGVGRRVFAGCAPLHPTVALLLGRLFRSRLSQNERSMFAFLSSGEPFGFQEYLRQAHWSNDGHRPFYRLDNLYDYIMTAMGSLLYIQAQGKKWAEIEDALDRLPKDAVGLEARLVKAIGLLDLLGDQRRLKASDEILVYALSDGGTTPSDDVHSALARLGDWGITVYRRFKDSYALWQGSDIDLNQRFDLGLAQIDRTQSLATLLRTRGQVRPYIAKRHLHQTGTFRFFVPWIIDFEELQESVDRPFGSADGAIVFILGTNGMPVEEVLESAKIVSRGLQSELGKLIFFAIPKGVQGIREAFEEKLAWEWVSQNTPGLEGDSIARRELAARHLGAQERLDRASARCFEPTHSYHACRWVYDGAGLQFESARELTSAISDACDRAYESAPIVQNELINRRRPSSAAVAARRNLIEQMLTHYTQEKLGMEGYPPEMSMYLSVLLQSGLHHQKGTAWAFGPPEGDDPCRITPLWQAIDAFLTTTEAGQRPVPELYDLLRRPPLGIKNGLLPIYLVAAVLHWQAELALYEEGSFIPEVGPAECERLMRVPKRFSLQRYRMDESQTRMLYEYSILFGDAVDPGTVDLVAAVRPILAFARQLPRYTLLTESLSKGAIAVREALFSAREPHRLLFDTLPQALEMPDAISDTNLIEPYFSGLKRVLVELQRAYEQLLVQIQEGLLNALLLPSDLDVARQEIAQRVGVLEHLVADLRLKAFVVRLGDTTLLHREWLESVVAGLTNKPPMQWNDGDLLRYRVALAEASGQFRRVEEVALDESAGGPEVSGRLIRVGITERSGQEQRQVVHITPEQESELDKAVDTIEEVLQEIGGSRAKRVQIIAELVRRMIQS